MAQISVIIPVYNCREYLQKCIESVINQTFEDWELILVDDGSTDGSGRICDEAAAGDERVHTVHKENGGGAGEARNAGVRSASAPFVVFIDSDDYVKTGLLETLHKAQEETDADVVVAGYIDYVEGEGDAFRQKVSYPAARLEGSREVRDFFVEHYPEGLLGFPWNKLYRTDLIKENGILFPKMRRLEDGIFNVEYFSFCESCVILDEAMYYYKNSEQVELRKLPYDFYQIMEEFTVQFYRTLEEWGYEKGRYERSMVDYFQNDFVCCLENICQPVWGKSFGENRQYMRELHEKKLIRYMMERPCESGNYTRLVWNAFCRERYRRVRFLTGSKRFLKTKCRRIFYRMKKGLNG